MNNFSAVFTWTNLLVVVAELDGNENEALDLVPLVTNVVLEVRQFFQTVQFYEYLFSGASISCWHCSHSRSWNCSNKFSVKNNCDYSPSGNSNFFISGEKNRECISEMDFWLIS